MEETVGRYARAWWLWADHRLAPRLARLLPAAVVLASASAFTTVAVVSEGAIDYLAWDTEAYWNALHADDPYAGAAVGVIGAYLYPPPLLQVLGPLARLPWPAFLFLWNLALAAAAMSLLRRVPRAYRTMLPLLLILAGADMWAGNINLLLAYGAVVALTAPAVWSGLALTKVTPFVGALWHGFRGRWDHTLLAVLLTVGLTAISYLAAPDLWASWLALVFSEDLVAATPASVPVPLFIRLPVAVVLVWHAARSDRRWLVPVACLVALPVIWFNGLSLLLGAAALVGEQPRGLAASPPLADRTAPR